MHHKKCRLHLGIVFFAVAAVAAPVSATEPTSSSESARNVPRTITKYIYPDGRIVYSEQPVAGARPDKTFAVSPQPAQRGDQTSSTSTRTARGSPQSEEHFSAESHQGKCRLSAESDASGSGAFHIRMEGLQPNESFRLLASAALPDDHATENRFANAAGVYEFRFFPQLPGNSRGEAIVMVRSAECKPLVVIPWTRP